MTLTSCRKDEDERIDSRMREDVLDVVQLMILIEQIRKALPAMTRVAQSLHSQCLYVSRATAQRRPSRTDMHEDDRCGVLVARGHREHLQRLRRERHPRHPDLSVSRTRLVSELERARGARSRRSARSRSYW